jgi:hypothetical protein
MDLQPIRQAARSQPFRPFQINLTSGYSFKIKSWERILVADETVVRIFPIDGGFEVYHQDDIATMEFLPSGNVPATQGSST